MIQPHHLLTPVADNARFHGRRLLMGREQFDASPRQIVYGVHKLQDFPRRRIPAELSEALDVRPQPAEIGDDVARSAEDAPFTLKLHDRDRRFGGDPLHAAVKIPVEHEVADDGDCTWRRPLDPFYDLCKSAFGQSGFTPFAGK